MSRGLVLTETSLFDIVLQFFRSFLEKLQIRMYVLETNSGQNGKWKPTYYVKNPRLGLITSIFYILHRPD